MTILLLTLFVGWMLRGMWPLPLEPRVSEAWLRNRERFDMRREYYGPGVGSLGPNLTDAESFCPRDQQSAQKGKRRKR